MKLLDPTPTSADLDSRGFTAILQALLGIALCALCFGSAVEAIGWISGAAPEPDEVILPGRGGADSFEYSADTAWFVLVFGLVFGILFALVTVALLRRAVGAAKRPSKKGRLAGQRERYADRNLQKHRSSRPIKKRTQRTRRYERARSYPSRHSRFESSPSRIRCACRPASP